MADGFEFGESAGLFAQARPAGGEAKGVIGGGEEIGGGTGGRKAPPGRAMRLRSGSARHKGPSAG